MSARQIYLRENMSQVQEVADFIGNLKDEDRLHLLAEALVIVNNRKPKPDRIEYQSIGCREWDLTMDYRDVDERNQ